MSRLSSRIVLLIGLLICLPLALAKAPAEPPVPPASAETGARVSALNARAADKKLDRNARCGAVFELFHKYLAPGVTSAVARTVLSERAWIGVDEPVRVLGGKIPVELNEADSTFVVHCYAEPTPRVNNQLWSDWVIYGRASGRAASTLREFLAAKDLKLLEYALIYPDGRIEQYQPSGRRSLHM